jgi:hypothetical protein
MGSRSNGDIGTFKESHREVGRQRDTRSRLERQTGEVARALGKDKKCQINKCSHKGHSNENARMRYIGDLQP